MIINELTSQYNSFWQTHNYNEALILIAKLRSYWGEDFSLYSDSQILQPDKLLISFAGRNGLDITQLDSSKITYSYLIKDFADYWDQQAKSIQDEKKRLQAISDASKLSNLFSGVDLSGITSFVKSNLLIIVLGLGVVLTIIILLKK